jgi:Mrp family chromosome partitioning ATPase
VVYFLAPAETWVDFGSLQANSRNLLLGVLFGLTLLVLGIWGVRWAWKSWIVAADPLPIAADPKSPAAEAFRFTAGSVERIGTARGNRLVVAFVSTHTGSDRSSVAANVAVAVAKSGATVLAVDADTSDGGLTDLLLPGSPPVDGFEQVLTRQRPLSECVQPSPLNQGHTVLGSAQQQRRGQPAPGTPRPWKR